MHNAVKDTVASSLQAFHAATAWCSALVQWDVILDKLCDTTSRTDPQDLACNLVVPVSQICT